MKSENVFVGVVREVPVEALRLSRTARGECRKTHVT